MDFCFQLPTDSPKREMFYARAIPQIKNKPFKIAYPLLWCSQQLISKEATDNRLNQLGVSNKTEKIYFKKMKNMKDKFLNRYISTDGNQSLSWMP
jgi:hypothetical protein